VSEIAALFRQLTAGVYVVGAAHNEQRDGFTAAWVMQVSFDPLLLALSINPENASHPLVKEAKAFTVNVLKQGQLEVARRFGTRSGREYDKLAGVRWHPGRSGAPVLEDALAYFDCELTASHPAGDHELLLGRVVDGRIIDPSGVALTYRETADMDGSNTLYPDRF
jgi:flavin reductase (DIM6/NTAB) family NADH-FMN oxidoreductase RutF